MPLQPPGADAAGTGSQNQLQSMLSFIQSQMPQGVDIPAPHYATHALASMLAHVIGTGALGPAAQMAGHPASQLMGMLPMLGGGGGMSDAEGPVPGLHNSWYPVEDGNWGVGGTGRAPKAPAVGSVAPEASQLEDPAIQPRRDLSAATSAPRYAGPGAPAAQTRVGAMPSEELRKLGGESGDFRTLAEGHERPLSWRSFQNPQELQQWKTPMPYDRASVRGTDGVWRHFEFNGKSWSQAEPHDPTRGLSPQSMQHFVDLAGYARDAFEKVGDEYVNHPGVGQHYLRFSKQLEKESPETLDGFGRWLAQYPTNAENAHHIPPQLRSDLLNEVYDIYQRKLGENGGAAQ
jgi:hypothetical protein